MSRGSITLACGLSAMLVLGPVGAALGAPIAVDAFLIGQSPAAGHYAADTPLAGQNPTVTGFSGAWAGSSALSSRGTGLTQAAAPWATGGAVDFSGTSPASVNRALDSYTNYGSGSGSYYYSSLMAFDTDFAAANGAMALTEFYRSDSSTYGVRWGFTTSSGTVKPIVRLRTMGSGWSVKTYNISVDVQADTTYLFIVKVRENYSSSNELIDVWLNPVDVTSEAAAGAASLEMSFAGVQDSTYALNRTALSVTGVNGEDCAQFDEVRFGTTWDDVVQVPEPAALAVLAGAMVVLRRQRQHTR
jgi:hypothetical protein